MARTTKDKDSRRDAPSHSCGYCHKKPVGAHNRASPLRLYKLTRHLNKDQMDLITAKSFGCLLSIACDTLPSDLSTWLTRVCFNAKTGKLVVPGRGEIDASPEAVHHMLGLPLPTEESIPVSYDLNVDAINFIHDKYGIEDGTTPRISTIVERIQGNKEASEDFLRLWLMIAISTSLFISPRCYPAIMDLANIDKMNWCQFVVDQIKSSVSKSNRNSVTGCIFLLVVLYLDSLTGHNVHIPNINPRVGAWDKKAVEKVIELDRKKNGSFGKLEIKESQFTVVKRSSFGGCVSIDDFFMSRLSSRVPQWQKRKLSQAFIEVFTALEKVVDVVSEIASTSEGGTSKAPGPNRVASTAAAGCSSKRTKVIDQEEEDEEYVSEDGEGESDKVSTDDTDNQYSNEENGNEIGDEENANDSGQDDFVAFDNGIAGQHKASISNEPDHINREFSPIIQGKQHQMQQQVEHLSEAIVEEIEGIEVHLLRRSRGQVATDQTPISATWEDRSQSLEVILHTAASTPPRSRGKVPSWKRRKAKLCLPEKGVENPQISEQQIVDVEQHEAVKENVNDIPHGDAETSNQQSMCFVNPQSSQEQFDFMPDGLSDDFFNTLEQQAIRELEQRKISAAVMDSAGHHNNEVEDQTRLQNDLAVVITPACMSNKICFHNLLAA